MVARFMLIDPIKRTREPSSITPGWRATLASMTRLPYDAQHLPFSRVSFVNNDSAFQFDVRVPEPRTKS